MAILAWTRVFIVFLLAEQCFLTDVNVVSKRKSFRRTRNILLGRRIHADEGTSCSQFQASMIHYRDAHTESWAIKTELPTSLNANALTTVVRYAHGNLVKIKGCSNMRANETCVLHRLQEGEYFVTVYFRDQYRKSRAFCGRVVQSQSSTSVPHDVTVAIKLALTLSSFAVILSIVVSLILCRKYLKPLFPSYEATLQEVFLKHILGDEEEGSTSLEMTEDSKLNEKNFDASIYPMKKSIRYTTSPQTELIPSNSIDAEKNVYEILPASPHEKNMTQEEFLQTSDNEWRPPETMTDKKAPDSISDFTRNINYVEKNSISHISDHPFNDLLPDKKWKEEFRIDEMDNGCWKTCQKMETNTSDSPAPRIQYTTKCALSNR